ALSSSAVAGGCAASSESPVELLAGASSFLGGCCCCGCCCCGGCCDCADANPAPARLARSAVSAPAQITFRKLAFMFLLPIGNWLNSRKLRSSRPSRKSLSRFCLSHRIQALLRCCSCLIRTSLHVERSLKLVFCL